MSIVTWFYLIFDLLSH